MHSFRLTSPQRLRVLVKPTRDARIVRRAVRLPELDSGMPVGGIAATLGVTRQTLYNWVERFVKRGGLAALSDRHGRGRPNSWTEPVRLFLACSLVSVITTTRSRSVKTASTRPAGFTAAW
jgi:transposase